MSPEQIQTLLVQGIAGATVTVEGADGRHYSATIVSEQFAGLSPVKRQQRVYTVIGDLVTRDVIHAISLQTYTPAEWEKKRHSGF